MAKAMTGPKAICPQKKVGLMVSEVTFFLLRGGALNIEPEKPLRLYAKLCTHEHMRILFQGERSINAHQILKKI